MLPMLVTALLLAAALWWTLAPLLRRVPAPAGADGLRRLDLAAKTENSLQEISDLEFDRDMGKIDVAEFDALRRDLVRETAGLIRELDEEEARAERARPEPSRPRPSGGAGAAALALLLAAAWAGGALAQAPPAGGLPPGHPPVEDGQLTAADTTAVTAVVRVTLSNGTTGAAAEADEVTISSLGTMGMAQIGSVRGAKGEATFPALGIVPAGLYLLQAAAGANRPSRMATGEELLAGPAALELFETTADASGLRVANLNLVLRRLPDALEASWLTTVENATQPPRAIVPGDRPAFELRVPGGPAVVTRMQANTGMMPVPIAPAAGSGPDRVGFDRALQPGLTRIDLTARLPYDGRTTLPLEASAQIAQVTVYAYPTDMKIAAAGLTEHGVEPQTGFLVLHAPAITPGRPLELRVEGGDPDAVARSPHGGMTAGGETRVVEQGPLTATTILVVIGAIAIALGAVVVLRRRAAGDGR